MIVKEKKYSFKTALVILDDKAALEMARADSFDRLVIISLNKLPLRDFRVLEKTTGVIKMRSSAEETLSSLSYENRHKIRKSDTIPGLTFISKDTAFDEAYRLYCDFQRARGHKPFPRSRFDGSLLFAAYSNGLMISCIFLYPSDPIARINFIFSGRHGSDKEMLKLISIASRRLVYDVCRWCIENQRTGLDLAFINTTDIAKAGIQEFKQSFNPQIVPEYIYTRSTGLYRILELIRVAGSKLGI